MIAQAFNTSTLEAETDRSHTLRPAQYIQYIYSEIFSKKDTHTHNEILSQKIHNKYSAKKKPKKTTAVTESTSLPLKHVEDYPQDYLVSVASNVPATVQHVTQPSHSQGSVFWRWLPIAKGPVPELFPTNHPILYTSFRPPFILHGLRDPSSFTLNCINLCNS